MVTFRLARRTCMVSLSCAVVVIAATGCGDEKFAVGDCVELNARIVDQELESAECPSGDGDFDPSNAVYKVDEVIEGTDGNCTPKGFGSIEFTDEPADATYCLSIATA